MADEYIRKQEAIDIVAFECGKWTGLAKEISKQLKQLPTADVAPVVHGKWRKAGTKWRIFRCNKCGNLLDFDGVNGGRGDANFCPNCGAKMDGGK
jgi:predicted RNA-binding Zn-ribbon protein involved in translation (DUF1610 family)